MNLTIHHGVCVNMKPVPSFGVIIQKDHVAGAEIYRVAERLRKKGIAIAEFDYRLSSSLTFDWDEPITLSAPMGSIQFVRDSGKWCRAESYDMFTPVLHRYSRYQHLIPNEKKLNNGVALTFSEIASRRWEELCAYAGEGALFLRPDQAMKVCEAVCLSSDHERQQWVSFCRKHSGLSEESFIWLSRKQCIGTEWRCLVSGGRVVSSSTYGFEKEPINDDNNRELVHFANAITKDLDVGDPAYMLDVAMVGGEFKVVELNCLSTSGVYALSPDAVADAWISALNHVYVEFYAF